LNTEELIATLDNEIDRLMQARKLLLTGASTQTRGRKRKGSHILSAAARARISAAQKKRWALKKKAAN